SNRRRAAASAASRAAGRGGGGSGKSAERSWSVVIRLPVGPPRPAPAEERRDAGTGLTRLSRPVLHFKRRPVECDRLPAEPGHRRGGPGRADQLDELGTIRSEERRVGAERRS